MNIFIGSVYPKVLFDTLVKRNQFVDYPANVFQYSLLKGLDEHITDLQVVTSPVIRSQYACVKDICKSEQFSHKGSDRLVDTYVGTFPVPGLQIVAEFWKVYSALKKQLKGSKQKNTVIIYALHSPFLLPVVLLRKRITCSCVVVPDLPEFMTGDAGFVRRIGKKIDRGIINFCLKRLDSYALLSPHMRNKLPIKDKPWVLMEGIYDTSSLPVGIKKEKERVILYTGSLSRRYGILELLNAFRGIDKENYRMWICGDGDGKEDVIRMAEQDERVKYYGIVSHQQVLEMQQQATVLINPRSSEGEYTKYSFPSKTMEYLASGTPTIMCHLPAIPQEYDEYLYYIEDESAEGIKNKLLEVCEKPQKELDEFGQKAAEFINAQKSAFVQAQKVADVMRRVHHVERSSLLCETMTWIKVVLVVGTVLSIWAIGAIELNVLPKMLMNNGEMLTSDALNKMFLGLSYSYLAGIFVYLLTVPFPQFAYRKKMRTVISKNINEIGESLHNMLIDFCGGRDEVRNPNLNDLDDCRYLLINSDWSSMTVIPHHLGRTRAQVFKDEYDNLQYHINIFINDYKDVLSNKELLALEKIRHSSLGMFVGFGANFRTDFSEPAKKMLAEQFCDIVVYYNELKNR